MSLLKRDAVEVGGHLPTFRRTAGRIILPDREYAVSTTHTHTHTHTHTYIYIYTRGFGGLGEACWPLVHKFAGSKTAEAVGFLGRKNPQNAFLRRGSKAVGPLS